jgi:hypothetical protein
MIWLLGFLGGAPQAGSYETWARQAGVQYKRKRLVCDLVSGMLGVIDMVQSVFCVVDKQSR